MKLNSSITPHRSSNVSYVKKIADEGQRKLVSTGLGVLVVVIVSGLHSLHCFVSLALGTAAVLLVHPRLVGDPEPVENCQ